jgi:hypothetical protein
MKSGTGTGGRFGRLRHFWRKSAAGRWWRYDCTLLVYRNDRPGDIAEATSGAGIGVNCRAHLERYVAEQRQPGRETFLHMCDARLAAGEQVYTICPEGELLAYAWLVPNQERSWLSAVARELRYPPRSCVMYNAYTRPAARGRGYNTLLAAARGADAFRRNGAENVFTSIEAGNDHAVRAKLATGFRPWLEITLRTRLGRSVHNERRLWDSDAGAAVLSAAASATRRENVATAGNTAPSPQGT